MDRLTALRVFVEVADRGSLTQAAKHLEMSPAMVSRYLAAVEQWFEARLLHRTTRKVSLSDVGFAALPTCKQVLELAKEAQHLAAERGREPTGVLRVTSSTSFADAQLAAALVDFQRQYKHVEIMLSVTDMVTDLVGERVDLAVRITNSLEPSMITRPLARCRSVLCASPDYLAQYGHPCVAADLRQHRCIAHAFAIGSQYRLTHAGETLMVPVDWSFHTNETAVLRRAVLSGAGIGMLPTYYVGDELQTGRLVQLMPDHEPDVLGIHAIYMSRQHQPLALRILVDFLAHRFAGDPAPWDKQLSVPASDGHRLSKPIVSS